MKLLLVGVLILFSSISPSWQESINLRSVNTKKDGEWILKNYDLLFQNQNKYPLAISFHENFDIRMSIKGEFTCVSAPHHINNFYCDFFYSMFCVTQAVSEYPEFLKCYFSNEETYDNKLQLIKDCLPDDGLGAYEECIKDEYEYIDSLQKEYASRNYNELARYAMNQSLMYADGELNMKAYFNLEAFINGKDLPEDSEDYTQEECDNKFEVENVVRSCKYDKPLLEIFFEADDSNNINIFSTTFMKNARELGIANLAEKVVFVPYGNTKQDENGNYICDTEDKCHGNSMFACIPKLSLFGIDATPFNLNMFHCISSSTNKSVDAVRDCLEVLIPNRSKDIYLNLLDCARNPDSLKEVKELTELRKVQSFPQIYLNKNPLSLQKSDNIFQKVCDTFIGIRPRLCSNIEKKEPNNILEIYYNPGKKESIEQLNGLLDQLLQGDDSVFRLINYLDIRFVPWGETNRNEDGTIDCSKSDESQDCKVSRTIACVHKIAPYHEEIPNMQKNSFVRFVKCFYNQPDFMEKSLNSAVDCLDELSPTDFYPFIMQCLRQDSKLPIWYEAGVQTEQNIGASFEKSIYIKYQNKFLDDGKALIDMACKQNFDPKPAECLSESSSAVTLVSSFLTLIFSTIVIVFY